MKRGYIKVWRKIQDSFIYGHPELLALFVNLCLQANHKDKEFLFNGKRQVCKRGQLITGIRKLSGETGIPRGSLFRHLQTLKNETLIETQPTTKFTLITVKNYDTYQGNETQSGTQVRHERDTSETRVSTNNNVNNVNKDKNVKKIGAVRTNPQGEFMNAWKSVYKSKTGKDYEDTKKDYVLVANKIKSVGKEEIVFRAKLLLDLCGSSKVWFAKSMADFTVGTLIQHWNRLIPEVARAKDKTSGIDEWLRREMENG